MITRLRATSSYRTLHCSSIGDLALERLAEQATRSRDTAFLLLRTHLDAVTEITRMRALERGVDPQQAVDDAVLALRADVVDWLHRWQASA